MKFIFACSSCRDKEILRIKEIDKKINDKKGMLSRKHHSKMNQDNFMREAKEVVLLKNSQTRTDLLIESPKGHFIQSSSSNDGWKIKCSVCNKFTIFERGFGNL